MDFVAKALSMKVHLADNGMGRFIISLMAGHPYRLVSYWYLRKLKDPKGALDLLTSGGASIIVDSGLFSLMFGSEQGTLPTTLEAYRDYTRKYLDDMAEWNSTCQLVESDTHRLLGMDSTYRLREEFASLGSRCMYVWHEPEGLDGLHKLAQERDYVCISVPEMRMIASANGSLTQSGKVTRMVSDLLARIHRASPKPPRVHLLGCTVQQMMETRLAWSCDSTSWLSGVRFGNACMWTAERGLQTVGIRSPRFIKFRDMAHAANPDILKLARSFDSGSGLGIGPDDYILACLACAHAYALYQTWLDQNYTAITPRGIEAQA